MILLVIKRNSSVLLLNCQMNNRNDIHIVSNLFANYSTNNLISHNHHFCILNTYQHFKRSLVFKIYPELNKRTLNLNIPDFGCL